MAKRSLLPEPLPMPLLGNKIRQCGEEFVGLFFQGIARQIPKAGYRQNVVAHVMTVPAGA
ncbi:MAG: hypothetical protein WAO08_23415 [Hyphomicrobiaceae bacterium]